MNRYGLITAAAFVATLAAGCSTNGTRTAADDEEKTVVTGSRIPVKERTASKTDKKDIDDFQRQQRVFVPGAAGGAN